MFAYLFCRSCNRLLLKFASYKPLVQVQQVKATHIRNNKMYGPLPYCRCGSRFGRKTNEGYTIDPKKTYHIEKEA